MKSLSFRDNSIQCVALDAFGTIITPQEPIATIYHRAGQRRGSLLSEADVASRFRLAYRKREVTLQTSEAAEIEFWRQVVKTVFDDLPSPKSDDCFDELWHYFAEPCAWHIFADVAISLEVLKRSGREIVLASNFDNRLKSILSSFSLIDAFDAIVISSQVGWRKPAAEFYHTLFEAARRTGHITQPAQILMVGDDYQHDVLAAQATGMSALQICRHQSRQELGARQISSLVDLFENS